MCVSVCAWVSVGEGEKERERERENVCVGENVGESL